MFSLGVWSPHKPKIVDDEVSASEWLVFADRIVVGLNGHRDVEWESQRNIRVQMVTGINRSSWTFKLHM